MTRDDPPSAGFPPVVLSTRRRPEFSPEGLISRLLMTRFRSDEEFAPPASPDLRIVGAASDSEEILRPSVPKFRLTDRNPSRLMTFWARRATSFAWLSDGRRPGWEAWSEILPTRSRAPRFRATSDNRRFWSWFLLTTTRVRELLG
jgi:hypothetical protein